MKKGYVVQEVGYEYNDEFFYRHEDNSGVAKFVFFDKEKAEEKIIELIADLIKGSKSWSKCGYQPFQFSFDGEGYGFSKEKLNQLNTQLASMSSEYTLASMDDDDYELMHFELPLGLNEEQRLTIAKILVDMVKLYEVVEVEVDEG